MNLHTKIERKALGAYYTPNNLSQVLCDWAIRSSDEAILEPSFGGCGFLETSVIRLKQLNTTNPQSKLYGADIDPKAFDFLSGKLGKAACISGRFVHEDFIKTTPESFDNVEFDSIIGNPPYVSLHNMSLEQRESCFEVLNKSPFSEGTIGRNASLWGFFLLHSLSFLKKNGRVAWVLPSSLLHADYAKTLLKIYQRHFKSIKVIKLNERFFQGVGADEISVILLADGFNYSPQEPCTISYGIAENILSLQESIDDNSVVLPHVQGNYKFTILPSNILLSYQRIAEKIESIQLGDVANVIIGMVTGDNKTFVVDKDSVEKHQFKQADLKPIIARFSQLNGLIHNKLNHDKEVRKGSRCLLLCPENISDKHSSIRNYLAKVPSSNRRKNRTFPKRKLWYYSDDERYPDAFMSYMIHKGPRLVINSAKINCTNSIHRVFFKKKSSYNYKKSIAMSMLSSYSQLSAELEGRAYGSGVLKLEPTPAKKIKILINEDIVNALSVIFTEINKLLNDSKFDDARLLVDEAICQSLEIPNNTFNEFNDATNLLRHERYKGLYKE